MDRRRPGASPIPLPPSASPVREARSGNADQDHASVSILPVCQKRISRSAPVRSRSPPRFSGRMPGCRRTEDGRGHALPTHTVHAPPHAVRITRRTLGLLYILARCFSLHALASPSRRSQPRGSAHVTSAPPGVRCRSADARPRPGRGARARYVGLRAPINNTNDAALSIYRGLIFRMMPMSRNKVESKVWAFP